MQAAKITFIGGGNMATALIEGLRKNQASMMSVAQPVLVVADPSADRRALLADLYAIEPVADNAAAITGASLIVLAVKPNHVRAAAEQIRANLLPNQLIVSVAAGIRLAALQNWLGGHQAIVRAMPNTPAMVGSGATGLYAPPALTPQQRNLAESLMRAVGLVQWVQNEADIDTVTALSGSGPAYIFLVMEAMQAAAEQLGLPAQTARLLTLETVFGAARLAMTADESPAQLRARVTSPNGTTERGIAALEQAGLRAAFAQALNAAHQRSIELGAQLSADERAV
ncbi:MAG: pyrroline-5-carboxylate reductase [Halothiobacillus sp. 24-54-40]|jgi:pyrroline-5-carboxylate reductase|nr:MAG: pyrroline-5-carboxylate reductase [Halothiobacillus sp. 35-54-62]OYY55076.1 MAG: pyrroline-5-carboxylate reductase [Halothiobacillus sp. 28-55-5]OYZ88198.1 MAG: pyrroline-5-carboxylate reductase [Halothiobacillus sp. 24-54-40]OZA80690.1 MAG: pyrroline-5-carboxylate reductase [Halothiobacillus sp. 39-53-45]HQS01858.1 pyrroline-5-carboxylate reductase [Halothiobacillus sp.]